MTRNGRKYAYRAVEHRWNTEKKSCETKLEYYGTVDEAETKGMQGQGEDDD